MQTTNSQTKTRTQYAPIAAGLAPEARIKLAQIVGDPKTDPPIPGIFPVGKTTLYNLIRRGQFPAPIKPFPGCRASYWIYGDVLAAIKRLEAGNAGASYATPLMRKRAAGGDK